MLGTVSVRFLCNSYILRIHTSCYMYKHCVKGGSGGASPRNTIEIPKTFITVGEPPRPPSTDVSICVAQESDGHGNRNKQGLHTLNKILTGKCYFYV